jgi:hypothetical protein
LFARSSCHASAGTLACLLIILTGWAVPGLSLAETMESRDEWVAAIAGAQFDEPLYVTSKESRNAVESDVYAIVQHPFQKLSVELRAAAAWCEFIFLHLNVKACVHGEADEANVTILRIYLGKKYYEPVAAAERLELRLRVATLESDHLVMELDGERGPYGTRDFRMHLEAMPHGENESLVRLRYSLGLGAFTRVMMQIYFGIAGGHRVGFTAEKLDSGGNPVYIRGLRGMIERNVMRFYLALQVHLDTLVVPQSRRLDERLRRWFELTERYPRQLHELGEGQYIEQKHLEHAQQQALQGEYQSGAGKFESG